MTETLVQSDSQSAHLESAGVAARVHRDEQLETGNTKPQGTKDIATPLQQGQLLRHAHPRVKLDRLLDEVQNPHSRSYARYGSFVHSKRDFLPRFLEGCVRQEIHAALTTQGRVNQIVETVRGVPSNLMYYGRAIYLHIIAMPGERAIPRLYIGQAMNFAFRLKQHRDFRYRRDNPSFHNFAVDRSTGDYWVVLAQLTEKTERPDLVLNLLEMWMALVFETLPEPALDEWLGASGSAARDTLGLNVASPLDNGDEASSKASLSLLKDADDSLAREYFWDVRKRPRAVLKPRRIDRNLRTFELGIVLGVATSLSSVLLLPRLFKVLRWIVRPRK